MRLHQNIFLVIVSFLVISSIATSSAVISGQVSKFTTYVYECNSGKSFVVNYKDDRAWIFLPKQTVSLNYVSSESGAKYSDGKITFWSKGGEASLDTPNKKYRGCKNNRSKAVWEDAKLRGVDFRATGNEPGWYLEISEGIKLLFVGDYGQSRYKVTSAPPSTNQSTRTTIYSAQKDQLQLMVSLEARVCLDTMSGEQFETTVSVSVNGKTYQGCGKALH